MIVDYIILGLGNILGFEIIIATMLILTLLLAGMSRGIGVVSLMVTFMLSVYLLSSYAIGDVFLLETQFAIVTFMVASFLIGIMFFTMVIRE